jgi:hypothetical protein
MGGMLSENEDEQVKGVSGISSDPLFRRLYTLTTSSILYAIDALNEITIYNSSHLPVGVNTDIGNSMVRLKTYRESKI